MSSVIYHIAYEYDVKQKIGFTLIWDYYRVMWNSAIEPWNLFSVWRGAARPCQPGTRTHYNDVIMTTVASQITSLTVVYSDADQIKHQSSASLAFVRGIHRDRWIPRTKGQLRGKCFHLMTSSWDKYCGTLWLNRYTTICREKFCVEKIRDRTFEHCKRYTIWSRIACWLELYHSTLK